MITVYTPYLTDRLSYVLDFCFEDKGVDYQVIHNKEEWEKLSIQSINYSNDLVSAVLNWSPQGILFESDIYPSKSLEFDEGDYKLDGVNDPFGVIFFLLTNYTEYYNQDKDQHGRFKSENHPLVKLNQHQEPIVDLLIKEIWCSLGLDYHPIASQYDLAPTFDIDIAWAYKERPLVRAIGGAIKGGKPLHRLQVLSGAKKDPYDTYDQIREIASRLKKTTCFFLLGDYGPFDKNITWDNEAYQTLIKDLQKNVHIGIHPSYASYLNIDQILVEKKRLEIILGEEIKKSRQHFLRLTIPRTYQVLAAAGLKEDYSMGFADQIGFRAGTSFSYAFFDLIDNRKTDLIIHPFAYMDSALKDYLGWDTRQAIKAIEKMRNSIRAVGGTFSFIWHNSSIHNSGEWQGWGDVLKETLNEND